MSYQPIENYGVIGDLHTVAPSGWMGRSTSCAPPWLGSRDRMRRKW